LSCSGAKSVNARLIRGPWAPSPSAAQLLILAELTYQPPGACVTDIS